MLMTIIIIAAFIIWFSSIWIAVLSLLSFIGGWKKLSRLYPLTYPKENSGLAKYTMCSIKMGFVRYKSVVSISFTGSGLILEVMKIFSISHKPLYIPYNRITDISRGKLFTTFTKFKVEDKNILLYGKAGDELYKRLSL